MSNETQHTHWHQSELRKMIEEEVKKFWPEAAALLEGLS
jgi:hypothetical protein